MRLSDIKIGKTYICGPVKDVETGLRGVPVIPVAIGKFTTVSMPCGQAIVPFDGDKRREIVVAVRRFDADQIKKTRAARWIATPIYTPPSDSYITQTQNGRIRVISPGGREMASLGPNVLPNEWIPKIVSASHIRMSEEEFLMKNQAARELFDAVQASRERLREERDAYLKIRDDLMTKALPRTRAANPSVRRLLVDRRTDEVVISVEAFAKLVEKANIRGTKTLIRDLKRKRGSLEDAAKQVEKATTCATDAGL